MKLPRNLGLKAYLILFMIVATGNLLSLTMPDGENYIYYNTLLRFHHPAIIWHILGLLDGILGCLATIPLARRAFDMPSVWTGLFRLFFILRIVTLFLGHNYEWVVLKSAFLGTPLMGWLILGVWGLFMFPSFKEHYLYAFQAKE